MHGTLYEVHKCIENCTNEGISIFDQLHQWHWGGWGLGVGDWRRCVRCMCVIDLRFAFWTLGGIAGTWSFMGTFCSSQNLGLIHVSCFLYFGSSCMDLRLIPISASLLQSLAR
jgi:hypothetical protein